MYKTVNFVWIGNKLSNIEYLCMQSYVKNGHEVRLHCYEDIENVPTEVKIVDGNQLIPSSKIFKHRNSYAAFADWYRWELMAEVGGFYSDSDVINFKPLHFPTLVVMGWEIPGRLITPTVLGFREAGHRLAKEMAFCAAHPLSIRAHDSLDLILKKLWYKISKKDVKAIGWGWTAGPRGLTLAYMKNKDAYNIELYPQDTFYPIGPGDIQQIISPTDTMLEEYIKSSYCMHLWNEMWRQAGVDKNKLFPKGSLIDQMFEKYAPEKI